MYIGTGWFSKRKPGSCTDGEEANEEAGEVDDDKDDEGDDEEDDGIPRTNRRFL
jgi:hypothetical protein